MTDFLKSWKGKAVIIGTAVLLIAAAIALIFLTAGGETGYRIISVSKIFGKVTAENNGNSYEAYENMRLAGGYALTTGEDSYTRLSLDDDKYMKLEQESRVEFRNVGDAKNHITSIYLDHGALNAELVNPLADEESFIVTTPNAALAVRGTFYRVVVSFDETGDVFTDVYTYGGTIVCQRIMPDGTVVDEQVVVDKGYKARIKMDEIITVYVEELIEEIKDEVDPIDTALVSDSDIVDIYNASYHGHPMYLSTKELWQEIIDRNIDLTEYYSAYDMGEIEPYIESVESSTESVVESTTPAVLTTEETAAADTEADTEPSETEIPDAADDTTAVTTTLDHMITVVPPSGTAPHYEEVAYTSDTAGTSDTSGTSETDTDTTTDTGSASTTSVSLPISRPVVVATVLTTTSPSETSSESSSSTATTEPPLESGSVTVPPVSSEPEESTSDSTGSVTVPPVSSEPEESTSDSSSSVSVTPEEPEPEESSDSSSSEPEPPVSSEPEEYSDSSSSESEPPVSSEPEESSDSSSSVSVPPVSSEPEESSVSSSSVSVPPEEPEPEESTVSSSSVSVPPEEPEPEESSVSSSSVSVPPEEPEPEESTVSSSSVSVPPEEPEPEESSVSSSSVSVPSEEPEPDESSESSSSEPEPEVPEGIAIDEENFPDPVFREYVSDNFDSDDNRFLSDEEISKASCIEINDNSELASLKGIDYFTELSELYCSNTGIRQLDVSSNTALTVLDCSGTEIVSLDVSSNTALIELYCFDTEITSLDVSSNTALSILDCEETGISSLNVSRNTALTDLNCSYTGITSLDVSENIELTQLICIETGITSLNVSNNTELTVLRCGYTGITSLDVSRNPELTWLWCDNTGITYLDVSGNTKLEWMLCSNCSLGFVDVSNNPLLSDFQADGNVYPIPSNAVKFDTSTDPNFEGFSPANVSEVENAIFEDGVFTDITGDITYTYNCGQGKSETFTLTRTGEPIDGIAISAENFPDSVFRDYISEYVDFRDNDGYLSVEECEAVTSIDVSGNVSVDGGITSIDGIEYFTKLHTLDCVSNIGLTSFDVSHNTELRLLRCYYTGIAELDIGSNAELVALHCFNTKITTLNISNNTALTHLLCNNTEITTLDVSNNTALIDLECYETGITTLDVSKNTALETLNCSNCSLAYVDISNNPSITDFNASGNTYPIPSNAVKFDTSTDHNFDGFDPEKVSDVNNAVFEDGIFTDITGDITYTYDCGQGKSETFALTLTGEPIPMPVDINAENFPDDAFRNYVSSNFDKDGDNILSVEEISNATRISISFNRNIASLNGIEYFTALTHLDCSNTGISILDVSNNLALTYLNCQETEVSNLDVNNNTALAHLICSYTEMTSLDVSNNTSLTVLDCRYTEITSLDVGNNTLLTELSCSHTAITSLDVSNNTALTYLACSNCNLAYVDISNNNSISYFSAGGNTYHIPSTATTFETTTAPNFNGFKSENVSNVKNATFSNGIFTNIIGDITYTYDCGQGESETFTLTRTSSYSLSIPDLTNNILPLDPLLPPDLTIPEGEALPNGSLTDLREDQESSGGDFDISVPSEAHDEGETAPDTDSPADLIQDPEGDLPDSGDVPIEEVLALARGQPP